MENYEQPKDLTPEEMEQQKAHEEQQEQELSEEETRQQLQQIEQNIQSKEASINETQSNINEVRQSLGLPAREDTPPSIQAEQQKIEQLTSEKADIEARIQAIIDRSTLTVEGTPTITSREDVAEYKELNQRLEDLNAQTENETDEAPNVMEQNSESGSEAFQEYEKSLRSVAEEISQQSNVMMSALREREEQGFTPIMDSGEFYQLAAGIRDMGNLERPVSIDTLKNMIDQVRHMVSIMSEVQIHRTGAIRENPENLEKLAYGARQFATGIEESASRLPLETGEPELDEVGAELRHSLLKLSEETQNVGSLVSRMRWNLG